MGNVKFAFKSKRENVDMRLTAVEEQYNQAGYLLKKKMVCLFKKPLQKNILVLQTLL